MAGYSLKEEINSHPEWISFLSVIHNLNHTYYKGIWNEYLKKLLPIYGILLFEENMYVVYSS